MVDLQWDIGTAYDLFVSLDVVHRPAQYGLRPAWAAGVRSRLDEPSRRSLDQGVQLIRPPLHWLSRLPEPKDGVCALAALSAVPAEQRLEVLLIPPGYEGTPWVVALRRGAATGRLREADREALQGWRPGPVTGRLVDWCTNPGEFGERFLSALRAYQEVFFAEEERRIRPFLERALGRVRLLAAERSFDSLLGTLCPQTRPEQLPEASEWVLAPAYWIAGRAICRKISPGQNLFLFGARGPEDSLVPGDHVPEGLVRTLKALSDPSRLRILRYLSEQPLTLTELSRRLRLRPPTVKHHLDGLGEVGLVEPVDPGGTEKAYQACRGPALEAFTHLTQNFLKE